MAKTATLESLLRDAGHTASLRGADDARRRWDAVVEDAVKICQQGGRRLAPLEVIARLGWVTWFDAEGSFFEDGAHAKIVDYVLRGLGIAPEVRDGWQGDHLLVLELAVNGQRRRLTIPTSHRGDWVNDALLFRAIELGIQLAGLSFVPLSFDTADQTLCIVTLPLALVDAVCGQRLLAVEQPTWPTEVVVENPS